jgi:hypothetical protein
VNCSPPATSPIAKTFRLDVERPVDLDALPVVFHAGFFEIEAFDIGLAARRDEYVRTANLSVALLRFEADGDRRRLGPFDESPWRLHGSRFLRPQPVEHDGRKFRIVLAERLQAFDHGDIASRGADAPAPFPCRSDRRR